ncbi:MAG: beta-lactamase family protein, partial [Thermoflexales bacterium]|nr:beta-lactamase family protein [Thermoflexales bacterium]
RAQAVIDDLTGRGIERGLQVAAYLDGELVVDAWSGLADADTGRKVNGDTLFVTFSCTKGITATVVHMLAERGQLDYDLPIAQYWPEFASGSAAVVKATITIRQALCHQAGLPHFPPGVTWEQFLDLGWMRHWIEQAEPLWAPGTMTGYHAITFGNILGEVIRRIDGRTVGRIVAEEIARPLGASDSLFIGARRDVMRRIARHESAPPNPELPVPPPDHLSYRSMPPQFWPILFGANDPNAWVTELPASGGVMSARALARMYAALIGPPVDGGPRLLPGIRVAVATQIQTSELDPALGRPVPKLLGWFGGYADSSMSASPTAFGHPGAGGNSGFADPDHGFALAVTKNRMVSPTRPEQGSARIIEREIRDALGLR